MRQIAVFDLNKTLYTKSSKEEFFKFVCYRRNYKLMSLIQVAFFKALGKTHALSQTTFKENFFRYLDHLPPDEVHELAREFWSIEYPKYFHEQLLEKVDQLRADGTDVVVATGGLEIYVAPLMEMMAVDTFCGTKTRYSGTRHHVVGEAAKGEEKLRRVDDVYGASNYRIIEAYSDDPEPILDRAERAYLVDGDSGEIRPYRG